MRPVHRDSEDGSAHGVETPATASPTHSGHGLLHSAESSRHGTSEQSPRESEAGTASLRSRVQADAGNACSSEVVEGDESDTSPSVVLPISPPGPVAEGVTKIAPAQEEMSDEQRVKLKDEPGDDQHTSGAAAKSSNAQQRKQPATKRWYSVLYQWCFPPLRPYEEMCENVEVKSLWLFHTNGSFRRACLKTVKSKPFERLSLLLILTNCIFLAMDSNSPDFARTKIGMVLRIAEWFFLVAFTVEMVAKVLALGLYGASGSYLRDQWNIIDTVVVFMGWASLSPSIGNVSAMRTVRVLRPLRTITGVEGMRMLVATLIRSLPMLLDVLILCAFIFLIFGTVGVQTFAGALRFRCGTPLPGTVVGSVLSNVTDFMVTPGGEDTICGDDRMSLPSSGTAWFAQNGAPMLCTQQSPTSD